MIYIIYYLLGVEGTVWLSIVMLSLKLLSLHAPYISFVKPFFVPVENAVKQTKRNIKYHNNIYKKASCQTSTIST